MSAKRAATLLIGTLFLSACGGTPAPAPAPAGPPASSAAADAAELSLLPGTAKANNATPDTGDWATRSGGGAPEGETAAEAVKWVQLTASQRTGLKSVVVNGAGLTLYRFDDDEAKPSKATCNGDCAATWPPVLIKPGGKIFVAGVKKKAVGTVTRDDGTIQVTINGWPVYRFAKDVKPGDINGQGVGGTWFGVTPGGGKAVAKPDAGAPPAVIVEESPEAGQQPEPPEEAVGSAIFFTDAAFGDNGSSEGLGGPGCKDLTTTANEASSMVAVGAMKIWADKGCKGESFTVGGDIDDLATVGLDDDVESVRFL